MTILHGFWELSVCNFSMCCILLTYCFVLIYSLMVLFHVWNIWALTQTFVCRLKVYRIPHLNHTPTGFVWYLYLLIKCSGPYCFRSVSTLYPCQKFRFAHGASVSIWPVLNLGSTTFRQHHQWLPYERVENRWLARGHAVLAYGSCSLFDWKCSLEGGTRECLDHCTWELEINALIDRQRLPDCALDAKYDMCFVAKSVLLCPADL